MTCNNHIGDRKKFFWQNIICRFGVPRTLTVDNGKQFDSDKFKEFCKSIGIKIAFASVYHPESNRVVERANRVNILSNIDDLIQPLKRQMGRRTVEGCIVP